jgi:cellulose synthase/poly-beta-1,6-N-acetylglucosamine synthase-like glycosyltransferase
VRESIASAVVAFELALVSYFVAFNTLYLAFSAIALWRLQQHRRRWTSQHLDGVLRSPATPGVSVVAPAYNEDATIRESLRSLLMLHYPDFEVIVVNDGSKDATLSTLIENFGLVRAPVDHPGRLVTQSVRGIYRSLSHQDLVVIDKVNGGKADAINAGINAARHPLVCVIDADSLLEEQALTRAVLPFLEDPSTVAAGGNVRIVNGCTVDAGRVTRIGLPGNLLARFQVVEYLRAFLSGRVAQSAFNALLIISGAFGMFRRDVLVDAGGFRHDTIGEDMEIVTRLHRYCRDRGMRYRIVFQPDPVCWTEAPETIRVLGSQRNRWQRGTLQVLSYHRQMCGRARYGAVGLFAMPYYLLFEAAGPFIEIAGYVVTAIGLAFGLLDWRLVELLFVAGVLYGALISLTAVLLEEVSFRRYASVRDLLLLAGISVLESFGYRQLTTWWRLKGVIDFLRNKQGWGTMTRRGFLPKQV